MEPDFSFIIIEIFIKILICLKFYIMTSQGCWRVPRLTWVFHEVGYKYKHKHYVILYIMTSQGYHHVQRATLRHPYKHKRTSCAMESRNDGYTVFDTGI